MAKKTTTTTAAPARLDSSRQQAAADPQETVASNNSLPSVPKPRPSTRVVVVAREATTTEIRSSSHLTPSLNSLTEQATVEHLLSSIGKHQLLALKPKVALVVLLASKATSSLAHPGVKKNPRSLPLKYQGSQVQR